MTHSRKLNRLHKLQQLMADKHRLDCWADSLWRGHASSLSGCDDPDPDDFEGCPYNTRQHDLVIYSPQARRLYIQAPFCSARDVLWDTPCGTEYDLECDGDSRQCWIDYVAWITQQRINYLCGVCFGHSDLACPTNNREISIMASLTDFATSELYAAGHMSKESVYDGELGHAVLQLMKTFSSQGHSGMSASAAMWLFSRLASYKPLTPLTGEDSEWVEVAENLWQNKRYFSVFKDKDKAWNIDAVVFVDRENGASFTSKDSHRVISFPYTVPDKPEYVYSDNLMPVQPLDMDSYQKLARTTAIYPNMNTLQGVSYTALGLAGEAGEVCDQLKRLLRDDNGVLTNERRERIKRELGDVLWYIANMAEELGLSLSKVAQTNLDKLFDRKSRNALRGDGSNR